MRIGVITVGRDCADVLDDVLAPWIESMRRHDISMCLLTATFKDMGFPPKPDDATRSKMEAYALKYPDRISSVAFDQEATEAEVRDRGRQVLMAAPFKADVLWMLDAADEFYTIKDIDRIITFVERNSLMAYYSVALRNYVFDDKTYLVTPFVPPRIWWVRYGDRILTQCHYDNDMTYVKRDGSAAVTDKALPHLAIPKNIAWVRHMSWPSNERGRKKAEYQAARWNPPNGNGCSFAWDEAQNKLVFNQAYYERTKQALPETARDE